MTCFFRFHACCFFFFFKQKTAYEMRISDWSSDVCSSDLWAERAETAAERDRELAARAAALDEELAALAAAPPDLKHRAQALADEAQAARESEAAAVAALREGEQGAKVADRKLADANEDRKSGVAGKSVAVRVDTGGARSIKKKMNKN